MAAPSVFLPGVMIEVDHVPAPIAEAMIVRAAAEFCERSMLWAAWADPVPFEDGKADYVLTLPADARLAQVKELWFGDEKLKGAEASEIARNLDGWQSSIGGPSCYMMAGLEPPTLRFYPAPGAAEDGKSFTARLIYAPSLSALTLPDFLASRYRYEIAEGAASYLMEMAGKPWSSPERGAQLAAKFRNSIAKARVQAEHGQLYNPSAVRPREFGL